MKEVVGIVAILAFIYLLDSCAPKQGSFVHPAPAVVDSGLCVEACKVLAANACPEGVDARACENACNIDQSQGAASQLDPGCILDAGSTYDLRKCGACL